MSEEYIGVVRLEWLLGTHPDVRLRRLERDAWERSADEAIRRLRDALASSPGADIVGVSTRPSYAGDPGAVAEVLRELRPIILHVLHGNLVRAALWRLGAHRTRGWYSDWRRTEIGEEGGPNPPLPPYPGPFNPSEFTSALRTVEIAQVKLRRFVQALGLPVVRITDDQLLEAEEEVVSGILRRLAVRPRSVERPPVRRSHERLLDLYEDAEPLRRHLEGTPYLPMLEELTGTSGRRR